MLYTFLKFCFHLILQIILTQKSDYSFHSSCILLFIFHCSKVLFNMCVSFHHQTAFWCITLFYPTVKVSFMNKKNTILALESNLELLMYIHIYGKFILNTIIGFKMLLFLAIVIHHINGITELQFSVNNEEKIIFSNLIRIIYY